MGDRGVGVRGIRVGFGSRIVFKHSIDFTD